jgi:ABC-type sugar transport system ATPase subunit
VKIFSGVMAPDSGTITFDGQEVTFTSPADAGAKGVATVFQELSLFTHLTVAENSSGMSR